MRIVLIHGTAQSPGGWGLVAAELVSGGHDVVAANLIDVDPASPAAAYGDHVAGQISGRCDVVVAHSGAGLLLSTIAASLSAPGQVYLAAAIPDGSVSFADETRADPQRVVHEGWIGVDPTVDADAARHLLFHDCDDTTQRWALATLRPFLPLAVYDEVLPAGGRASMVIVPTGDRTLRADWMIEAARTRVGTEPILIDAGHCPHVSQPQVVAATIANFL